MSITAPLAVITALSLSLVGLAPTGPADFEDELRSATATQPTVFEDRADVEADALEIEGRTLTAPSPNGDISVRLPVAPRGLGLDNAGASGGRALAIEDAGDGAFRALVRVAHAGAPHEYRLEFGDDVELVPLEDGGVTVRGLGGEMLGVIAPPWAVDRDGAAVPTTLEVDGRHLVQRVASAAPGQYPVVADPFWIPALLVVAHFTRHAVTQAAARGVSQALVKQVVQNGARTAGKKGTSVFTQGKGANRIRVVLDNKSGNIITVTKG